MSDSELLPNENILLINKEKVNEKPNENVLSIPVDYEGTNASCVSLIPEEKEENIPKIKKRSKRVLWADCLRILACFLVIITHTTGYYTGDVKFKSFNWYIIKSYSGASRACVPFFVMISGMFFLKPTKKITIKQMYSKYILRIFKANLFWSFYYVLVDVNIIGKKFHPEFNKDLLIDVYKGTIIGFGHLWYLRFVMGLYMMTPIIKLITTDKEMAWYSAILFCCISQFIPSICNYTSGLFGTSILTIYKDFFSSLKIEMAGSFVTYYLFGYLFSIADLKKKHIYLLYIIGIVGTIATPALLIYNCVRSNRQSGTYLEFDYFQVCMSAVGVFIIFKYAVNDFLEKISDKEWVVKIITKLSECSFGIYLLHMTVYRLIYVIFDGKFTSQTINPILGVPLMSTIVFVLCFIITYLLRLIPFFKTLT